MGTDKREASPRFPNAFSKAAKKNSAIANVQSPLNCRLFFRIFRCTLLANRVLQETKASLVYCRLSAIPHVNVNIDEVQRGASTIN